MTSPCVAARLLVCSLMLLGPGLVAGQSQAAPTGVVTGKLLSKDGTPATGIRVSAAEALDPGGPTVLKAIVSLTTTDASGSYKLENIPAGRYYITSGLVDLPTYYPGVTDVSGATVVQITGGATVSGIDFKMVAGLGFSVSGRVLAPLNAPSAGLQATMPLLLFAFDSGFMLESRVQADGSFEFTRVRPGRYNMLMPFIASSLQPLNITVIDKDVTGIEVAPPVLVSVSGRVTIAGGAAVSNPTFSLSFAGSNRMTANVLSNGTFQTSLPAGEYRITPSAIPDGYYLKSITTGSTDLSQTPLKLSGPSSVEIVVILGVQPAADIRK